MNTDRSRGRVQRGPSRPASVMRVRSGPASEVRQPPSPHEHVPAPPAVGMPSPEDVRMEVAPEVREPVPDDRSAKDSGAGGRSARGPSSRQLLRRALSTPGAARQAFLLREVLGPPVALRTDATDRPT